MELTPTLMFGDFCNIIDLSIDDDKLEDLIKKCYEFKKNIPSKTGWKCDTYSTFGTDVLFTSDGFINLIKIIGNEVNEFSNVYGKVQGVLNCKEAWINISEPGNYQEYHKHPLSHFSAVFYLKAPENCGRLILKSHESDDDMFPLLLEPGPLQLPSFKTYTVLPKSKRLIIFRSNISHMVEKNFSEDDRISLAANFVYEK